MIATEYNGKIYQLVEVKEQFCSGCAFNRTKACNQEFGGCLVYSICISMVDKGIFVQWKEVT